MMESRDVCNAFAEGYVNPSYRALQIFCCSMTKGLMTQEGCGGMAGYRSGAGYIEKGSGIPVGDDTGR